MNSYHVQLCKWVFQQGVLCVCFRLCTEYEALHKIEMEGNDFINQFMQK